MLNWIKNLAGIAVVALLAACGGSNPVSVAQGENLAKIASAQGFTSLVAAAEKAGLTPTLTSGSASLTVFAPSNKAFDDLAKKLAFSDGAAMVAGLDGPTLAKILQYHVLPSRKTAAELSSGGATQPTLYTYGGSATTLALKSSGSVTLTDAVLMESKVTAADVSASNGVIHAIDNVLIPPGLFDVVQMAKLIPNFSVLVDALVKANLVPTLSGAGPLTVFAPSNKAFDDLAKKLAFSDGAAMVAGLDGPTLAKILQYHVLPSRKTAAELSSGGATQPTLYTYGGSATTLALKSSGSVTLTDAVLMESKVTAADVSASSGMIHAIDNVLIPPGLFDIVKMAKLNPVFSVFVEALGKTDLAQSLSGAGPFTVFAPTDTAFTAVLAELRLTKEQMLSLPDLILLLAYHVADGKLLAADLAALTKPALLPTALGVPISIGVDMGITDAANRVTKLVGTDIVGSNGVIHVTDKVLLPFPPT